MIISFSVASLNDEVYPSQDFQPLQAQRHHKAFGIHAVDCNALLKNLPIPFLPAAQSLDAIFVYSACPVQFRRTYFTGVGLENRTGAHLTGAAISELYDIRANSCNSWQKTN